MHCKAEINAITKRIIERSASSRERYLMCLHNMETYTPHRNVLSCANLAHGVAIFSKKDKKALLDTNIPNLGIITSYNDMLSAHQPFEHFPRIIKEAAKNKGAIAQVAGGVPAMCDGITQGTRGMELSLFSRDVIAMSAAIGLSHNMFDAAMYLGVCDKIVPGLFIAAVSAGHLPSIFIPAGPMPSGLSNEEKVRVRQLFAEGKIKKRELLEAESKCYHSPGTCTFYGTANSNQMFMEIMGLHTPGSSFVNPNTPLRDAFTREAVERLIDLCYPSEQYMPIGRMIDERSFVNAIVGLHATGGSTNHTIHLVAMAAAAGIQITWKDIADLSEIIPLLTRIYPNGTQDVNDFNQAGGMGFLIRELLDAGYLHPDVQTVLGQGLYTYAIEAHLNNEGTIQREPAPLESRNPNILISAQKPFQPTGGLKILVGNIGQAIIKTASLPKEKQFIEAPALVLNSQEELEALFKENQLNKNFVAVIRFQGPKANGMPELHKLTTILGVLQNRGFTVALLTDGRMSGASGKIPAAIHLTPEAAEGGAIAKIQDGDMIQINAEKGSVEVLLPANILEARETATIDLRQNNIGYNRNLFKTFREKVNAADLGATIFDF